MSARRRTGAAALVVGLLVTAGCAEDPAPRDTLADELVAVDRAVVADDPDRIRTSVAALRSAVEAAVADGALEEARADAVDRAAQDLLDALAAREEAADVPPPAPAATTEPPTEDDEEAREEAERDAEKEAEKAEREAEKAAEKAEKEAERDEEDGDD